jgi:hypothetical protein
MRDKIKELVEATLIIGARRADDSLIHYTAKEATKQHIESLTDRYEKYIISLLEEQKRICEHLAVYSGSVDEMSYLKLSQSILNAPYPSEVVESDLVVIDKEKLKELENKAQMYDNQQKSYKIHAIRTGA